MSPFERDIAVIGAGRIGVPWAAVMASTADRTVTCVDINEDRVDEINSGAVPFEEPGLDERLRAALRTGNIHATTETSRISNHQFVVFAVNAPRNRIFRFYDTVRDYVEYFVDDQIVVNRTTLPVSAITEMRDIVVSGPADTSFATFPERLAEGKAIEEIQKLPKIIGVDDTYTEQEMSSLLTEFDCPVHVTDPETAMFIKLIDNAYRDALFAISNQIAFTADQLDLNAHEAIELANEDYPRNDIPTPGTVGGKCLPKDPHFLTDERICDQPTTPDLFTHTRRANASLQSYIVTEVLRRQSSPVSILGQAYKRNVSDVFNSPAAEIRSSLVSKGIDVKTHDPHSEVHETTLSEVLDQTELVLLAVNHDEYENIEPVINERVSSDAVVYDIWGMLDSDKLDIAYDGFGIKDHDTAYERSNSQQTGK